MLEEPLAEPSSRAEGAPLLPPDDHRALAARLDLCHFQDEAPGMVFWHPRGWALYRALEDAVRAHVRADGYQEVRTPQLIRKAIWERSGHWGAFQHGMFLVGDDAALKPVSCPGHIQIVRRAAPSWRDLPLRLAELGLCHRDEASGTLHGLLRLRQFTQDDGHIFCAEEHVAAELDRFLGALPAFYRRFGFDELALALALRPEQRIGDDADWDRAERALADAVARLGLPCELEPGGGAIYGPKLEVRLRDRRGRVWQLGTIQLDLVMPKRFGLVYVDRDGARRPLVMLHRALFGSLERFLGILLEQHGAHLPAWLAPEQIVVAPVGDTHLGHAHEVAARLAAEGLRVRLAAADTLGRRIAAAHHDGVPFAVVIGDRELAAGTLALRAAPGAWRDEGEAQRSLPLEEAVRELARACTPAPGRG